MSCFITGKATLEKYENQVFMQNMFTAHINQMRKEWEWCDYLPPSNILTAVINFWISSAQPAQTPAKFLAQQWWRNGAATR